MERILDDQTSAPTLPNVGAIQDGGNASEPEDQGGIFPLWTIGHARPVSCHAETKCCRVNDHREQKRECHFVLPGQLGKCRKAHAERRHRNDSKQTVKDSIRGDSWKTWHFVHGGIKYESKCNHVNGIKYEANSLADSH